ncbi:hypothetical protein [Tenggerimyces flavus]|uniref:Uncharacterized protein n=1 Tax=Tenggerimyces flavus TaxID=1708749 RepID=A0ABV7YPH8_9ACTN|nr:hypothetical protein [Tenggerimyces flavus]MBM7790189.1 hypothetical protein [Tenggerimyces flavus]
MAAAKPIGSESKAEKFATQATRAGLNAVQAKVLQAKVDKEVAKRGGKQISANEVLWKGGVGKTVIAAPGQKQAVSMAGGKAASAACEFYYICFYSGTYRTGDKFELFYCDLQYVPMANFRSYDNNQTGGTQAAFYNGAYEFIGLSEPAHSIVDEYYEGYKVWYVDPC